MKFLVIIIYGLLSSGGLILVKYGLQYKTNLFKLFGFFSINIYTIMGIIMYILSFLLYMFLLLKNNISYIIPVSTAITYLIIFVASIFVIKESFSVLQLIGYFIIILGVIFVNIK